MATGLAALSTKPGTTGVVTLDRTASVWRGPRAFAWGVVLACASAVALAVSGVAGAEPPTPTPGPAGGVSETMSVGVLPGPFKPPPATIEVLLQAPSDHARVQSGSVRLRMVDARGSLQGWQVLAAISECRAHDGSRFRPHVVLVKPSLPTVVDGDQQGLLKGRPHRVTIGEQVFVFGAAAGHGGGTYEDRVTVTVMVPDDVRGSSGAACVLATATSPVAG